jgi:hypothetical protein
MPRLNAKEQTTTGYGACWLNGSVAVANDHGSEIRTAGGSLLAARPCNFVYANGAGRWMAFHSPANGAPTVFGPGFEIVGAGMPLGNGSDPVGPDGSFLYKLAFNSAGPYGFFGGPDIPGDFDQIQNLGGFRAIGTLRGEIRGFGISIPPVRGFWPRWKDGHLLYQTETGELVLDGRIVGVSGNYFRPDFNPRADGSFLIVWSPDAGESSVQRRVLAPGELATLPLYGGAPIVIEPPPAKEPPVIPNRIADVAQIRADYPTPLAHKHAAFLIDVAQHLKGKLFRKDGGAHVTLPNGVNVSMDILILPQQRDSNGGLGDWWIDILGDAENTAVAIWDAHPNAGGEFVDVSGLDTGGGTVVIPPTPSGLEARVKTLESACFKIIDEIADLQHAEADRLDLIHQLEGSAVRVGDLAAFAKKDDLAGFAKKGDAVEVSGRVSVFGVNKWGGKIL